MGRITRRTRQEAKKRRFRDPEHAGQKVVVVVGFWYREGANYLQVKHKVVIVEDPSGGGDDVGATYLAGFSMSPNAESFLCEHIDAMQFDDDVDPEKPDEWRQVLLRGAYRVKIFEDDFNGESQWKERSPRPLNRWEPEWDEIVDLAASASEDFIERQNGWTFSAADHKHGASGSSGSSGGYTVEDAGLASAPDDDIPF